MSNKKICIGLFGSSGVGKSSIIYKRLYGIFSDKYIETIEDCYFHYIDGIYCHLIDSSGCLGGVESSIRKKSLEDINVAILVYDVTRKESLEELVLFVDEISACKRNILVYMVSNKIDLLENVKNNEVIKLAESMTRKYKIKSHGFVSAKDGDGITELFSSVIHDYLPKKKQKKNNCCILQ